MNELPYLADGTAASRTRYFRCHGWCWASVTTKNLLAALVVAGVDPLKQRSDALVFSSGSLSYNSLRQRFVSARYYGVRNQKRHISGKTTSDPSKTTDVAGCPLMLELQFT